MFYTVEFQISGCKGKPVQIEMTRSPGSGRALLVISWAPYQLGRLNIGKDNGVLDLELGRVYRATLDLDNRQWFADPDKPTFELVTSEKKQIFRVGTLRTLSF